MAAFAATFETPAGVVMGPNPIMMQFGASTPIMVSAVGDGTLKVTNCPKKQFKRAQAAKRVARETEALKQKPAGIRKDKKLKPVVLSAVKMDALIKQVFMLARDKGNCSVHLVGKETLKVDFPRMNGKIYARVGVRHMENVRVQRDLTSSPLQNRWLRIAMSVTQGVHQHSVAEVKEGWSGFLLNASRITGNISTTRGGTLVVRGAYAGKLFDARVKLNAYTTLMINQFSSPGEKFWTGFNGTFLSNRTQDREHECMTNLDVLKCGQVAALLCLAMFPCGRITCQQCVDDNLHSEGQATNDKIIQRVNTMYSLIKDKYPEFKHALMILERYSNSLSNINKNYEAFAEIQRISDGRNVSAFAHITHINAVLIKGASATSEDFTQATNHLLEVTRFLKNRTENIEKGSLKHFRNKISQKAQLNPSLMCDNQLDKNGNFVWGERGRHAKRFFSNYFELINPADGYLKYEIRNNPNGARKLAINRLIVPTDFEALREQMKGEPVMKHPITKECVSMTNGDYVHSCCCITTDAGEPLFSELQMPTKHHLVIGNSGDPKYIDLPTLEAKRMYIARDGYCYINIFLAMLVNVNESDAKAFTKMVRDTMIEKLGKWPTLLDVATACYFLKVFFPEVGNAELPRMYVDHTTKTIHVLDSYGSLTTGYHIMKANTVEQLIKFTRHSLESDLKHYLVGGDPLNEEATERELCDPHYNLKMLIECIYDPREMEKNLIWNKYLPIYAMLSPGVLLALYNSGSMEALMNRYLRKDNDFVVTLVVLESLARKVSVASSVAAQVQVLERGAAGMIEAMQGVKQRHLIPYTAAMQMLMVMIARSEANAELDMAGYMQLRTISLEVMEKNYLQILEEGWHALSWRGKLRAMWRSSKFAICTRKGLTTTSTADLDGRYSESITSYCAQPRKLMQKSAKSIKRLSTTIITKTKNKIVKSVCNTVNYIAADLIRFVNTLLAISLILTIAHEVQTLVYRYLESQRQNRHIQNENDINRLEFHYKVMRTSTGVDPTLEEFKQYIAVNAPDLVYIMEEDTKVKHQTKRKSEQGLERVIAFIALVLMMFDCERSDCVTRILTKLKTLVSTVEPNVYHQKLDDIEDDLSEKRLTIDFELTQDPQLIPGREQEPSFAVWWNYQLAHSLTVPHYRTEGKLVVFTRTTAVQVANEIAGGTDDDILLIGAVGSGKSTGLPYNLSKKGNVLLIEPTRPLAENVHKQLAGDPFFANTTLRMRGLTKFGSAPITIMTSGFALNYFAHNRSRLGDFGFVIFDECHVDDANAMAFRCLMVDTGFAGKFIKMSATPPGRELDFKTQYPVNIIVEESLSLQEFARSQGSGANCDTTKHGDNILVYVASYNEVDMLANLLTEAGHKVTKVDGRTMKVGRVEILTSGTSKKKHFIVATNIIENGVTLDIEVVVDFGVKVVPYLDSDNRMMLYRKVAINYGERIQRLGRVGRNKPGTAIRIGHTEKGLSEIPSCVATEAAFKCFTYGLPVITNNVTTSILSEATVRQARTMACFEITPFYMVHLVRFDGTMHHAIHGIFKKFKLRDSEIALSKLAIPSKGLRTWLTAREYLRLGANVEDSSDVRIPFMCKDIPEKLHTEVWEAIQKFKNDAGFQRLSSASACKIAYTLQTDCLAIQRTVHIIETLMAEEKRKQEYFRTITANTVSSSTFSLQSIANAIRSRYATDHTMENIGILESAKAQLLEFQNLSIDQSFSDLNSSVGEGFLREFGALETVHHQNLGGVSETLKLRGRWNHSLITNDLFVLMGVLCGGAWMVYDKLRSGMAEDVVHEAKGKRQRQKLKFRQTRDNKVGREVYGDDGTMEHYFGAAYTKKGKTSGRTRGMGAKSRRFINMYNFDPEDFTAVRFVDPLTGATLDENPMTDIHLVQEYFTKVRNDQISEDLIEPQHIISSPGIQAYYTNNRTGKALKLDLTPHNPLALCNKHATIAGFPEREFELRQTGQPVHIDISDVPVMNEVDVVEHESSSLFKGLRDYNPIASSICQLVNKSDGHVDTLYGLGYGPLIITNRHLFERNNGELIIRTRHGEFTIRNSTTVKLLPIPDRDIILVRLPKDIPPFPQRFTFRLPKQNERVCLVGSNFQTKSISSMVSEPSTTLAMNDSHFWKHWISTKDGQCGSPIVSTQDGAILGLHSLSNFSNSVNYFASFPENFREEFLETLENHAWVQHWKYNTEHISWGALNIKAAKPADLFKTSKLVTDLEDHNVYTQVCRERWLMEQLNGNLKAIATCPSQLVTKHVVKGKCQMFDLYLRLHDDAREFFEPLLGHYQKSQLNREAYTKDIMKYATTIEAGKVDCDTFEQALSSVIRDFERMGFETCNYVTNDDDIFGALNMKSAVGALYTGKKRDYLKDHTKEMREELLKSSCLRLFKGEMGVWNGSLKAELRPLEKVLANKTRTFTAAPIDTLLGGKVCVDDFNNQFYDLNIRAPWSVGMTKFYRGWNEMLDALPDGWIYCDADGSQFDSSLSPYLINAVLNLRLRFMEDWDVGATMLQNLYTEIVYTPISTPDCTLIKKYKGNNSGQPSTVVDNTLMVILALRYSLIKSGYEHERHDDICRFFVNGDDLLLAVHPEHEALLDSFQETFGELGLKYTFTSRHKDKGNLWFMSHQGIKRDGIWIPKLEKERIVSILEWDRSEEPLHRTEAICAAMIEAWGYDDLMHEIRKFYAWLLEQAPFSGLAATGKAPYIAESALRRLYLNVEVSQNELERYVHSIFDGFLDNTAIEVYHQSGPETFDAGREEERQRRARELKDKNETSSSDPGGTESGRLAQISKDKDINVGTHGTFSVPRLKHKVSKMNLPKFKGRNAINLDHLIQYEPEQTNISNVRATKAQFDNWVQNVQAEYDVDESQMQIILNGLMVWCIENGTSPNINGVWVMMEGETQVEFPLKPIIDHAKPTLRQIMAHFSNVAEAYIEMRNQLVPYMPRYGLQRNLTDISLARYAFDFYEMTSKTPVRAREAHIQMKAAALRGARNDLFGLDGNVGPTGENTERHTTDDVNRNMHNLLGMRGV